MYRKKRKKMWNFSCTIAIERKNIKSGMLRYIIQNCFIYENVSRCESRQESTFIIISLQSDDSYTTYSNGSSFTDIREYLDVSILKVILYPHPIPIPPLYNVNCEPLLIPIIPYKYMCLQYHFVEN